MLEHLCVNLEQESKEALATWVLVQIYTQSSFFHAKLQTKIAKKYRQKKRTVYRSEQEPTWQVPLWTLVQDSHTNAPT
jgi:hypothetical protein